jgi:GNAT superfamily N-acetyltransferase
MGRELGVRRAGSNDIEAMVLLAAKKREQYRDYSPTFHRPADDAIELQRPWFEHLVEDDHVGTLVHEDEDGVVDGFLIASLVPAPPVYDPGGLTCLVDDFAVADPSLWAGVGRDLLRKAQAWAQPLGAAQTVVVCGPRDEPKRRMLLDTGLHVASEWLTAEL